METYVKVLWPDSDDFRELDEAILFDSTSMLVPKGTYKLYRKKKKGRLPKRIINRVIGATRKVFSNIQTYGKVRKQAKDIGHDFEGICNEYLDACRLYEQVENDEAERHMEAMAT
jgi:hypothetical protein|tara:strand:+ start:1412 stop:1756 length:345 start_codon:yes stop_codon:yes gene_type:complete